MVTEALDSSRLVPIWSRAASDCDDLGCSQFVLNDEARLEVLCALETLMTAVFADMRWRCSFSLRGAVQLQHSVLNCLLGVNNQGLAGSTGTSCAKETATT
jgi:hypothetical protein